MKEQFLKRYESDVQTIARQYIHVGEPLEDMLQDGREAVIMAAISLSDQNLPNLDEEVRRMIRQYICRALREHGYTLRIPRRLAEKSNHHPVIGLSECKEVQELADMAELSSETLLSAVDGLSPKQQTVIRLSFGLEGNKRLDTQTLAQQMGIGQNAVQHLRKRALKKLKNVLKN